MHKDASQIQLHLESYIDICSVDSRTPPQSKSAIGNLIQTGALCVGQLFEFHAFFES